MGFFGCWRIRRDRRAQRKEESESVVGLLFCFVEGQAYVARLSNRGRP